MNALDSGSLESERIITALMHGVEAAVTGNRLTHLLSYSEASGVACWGLTGGAAKPNRGKRSPLHRKGTLPETDGFPEAKGRDAQRRGGPQP